MPRILRNYLISFAIIGGILTAIHFIDQHMQASQPAASTNSPQENVSE